MAVGSNMKSVSPQIVPARKMLMAWTAGPRVITAAVSLRSSHGAP
jgi:hypothetical protein